MPITNDELKDQLGQLPAEERAELARYLIDTLGQETAQDTEPGWIDELTRRAQDFESGREPGIPADEVFATLRQRFP